MPDFEVLEPAIDPSNRISFLLDWELTMKCNLDCSYCSSGTYGGHDNSTKHPPTVECLSALDFMFEYADLYMSRKPKGIRYVVLNVYGGESLHHPDIVEILSKIQEKYQPYRDRWHLTVTTTTNAIASDKKLKQIIPLIDEFTVSYHSECTAKQKQQFKENLLTIRDSGKRLKCIVMMHQDPNLFQDATNMLSWLTEHNIKLLPKQLDGSSGVEGDRIYNQTQIQWFNNIYNSKTFGQTTELLEDKVESNLTDLGRACCGGRSLCANQNYRQRNFYVENKFPDWYCSVNHFFLYVKQVNGEVYVNKDCKMNFDGQVGPIGNLNDTIKILSTLKNQLDNNNLPIIQCKKYNCWCGLCAPKAKNLDTYNSIMKKYQKDYVI
jgi:pyruvate-formate lyase-activating enzyme